VNTKPGSPTADGLFFLYDFDSKTFRTSSWVWTWGITIKLLIEASKIEEGLKYTPEQLITLANRIGNRSLFFQINDKTHPADGIVRVREALEKSDNTFWSCASPADAMFLAGWGWMPLYEITGDERYLEASKRLALAVEKVVEDFIIPPQDYYENDKSWADHGINESGFGTQGLSELYRVTQDDYYLDVTKKYMQQHLDIYQEANGLWKRLYMFETNKATPVDFWTRGMGWGMMGLLACDNIMPGDIYISWATKMGNQLISYQNEDGSWNHKMNSSSEEFGKCEKSTSLWCMLFYQLYSVTKDEKHLNAARKALNWCMENQYMADNDPDGYGSLPGRTFNSGIDYREWFNLSCSYSTGFFGLACIQELGMYRMN
jgi:rhamnogalacturonyl hydrolase YesR